MTTPLPYPVIGGLENVYFEDSFVLDIVARRDEVVFSLDLVLTPDHPMYRPPGAAERHCYRRAELVFGGVRELRWRNSDVPPSRDASGEIDLGNIDSLTAVGGAYELEGDWGSMRIEAATAEIRLLGAG
jgi:hypothetical protein